MTAEKLKLRLGRAADVFQDLEVKISGMRACSLTRESLSCFQVYADVATRLRSTVSLVDARQAAEMVITRLISTHVAGTNNVSYGDVETPFPFARVLAFQSYATMAWSICDRATKAAGHILCTSDAASKKTSPPALHDPFMAGSKTIPGHLQKLLRMSYAWPVSFAYSARNILVHEGGLVGGEDIFRGSTFKDGFELSDLGWAALERSARHRNGENITPEQCRTRAWPGSERDLHKILAGSHAEMDDAIGIIVSAAAGTAELQVKHLFERDADG